MALTEVESKATSSTGQDKSEIAHLFLPGLDPDEPRMALCGYVKRNPQPAPDMPRCTDCMDIWRRSA